MAKQDRSGTRYEKLLAYSLEAIGYDRNIESKINYLQPRKNSEIVISGTYIQPDLLVRHFSDVVAVIYSTHWSNTRSSKYKYWRTWEEQAQQRVTLGDKFLSINCVFEALPQGSPPMLVSRADELPADPARDHKCPIQLEGWDPGIGWALIESFDVSIVFPKGYTAIADVEKCDEGDHDPATTQLLAAALKKTPKKYFSTQWNCIRNIKAKAPKIRRGHLNTSTRYRIGLLHIYLLIRLCELGNGKKLALEPLIGALAEIANNETDLKTLGKIPPFDGFNLAEMEQLLAALAGVYVRKGKRPESFCTLRTFSHGATKLLKVKFNKDLQLCVADLVHHLKDKTFVSAIQKSFARFDRAFGVAEAIEDLADIEQVKKKVGFVEKSLMPYVRQPKRLGNKLLDLQSPEASSRSKISAHVQNWHFEILLYLCGLNSAEDIQTRFKERFEAKGHMLRPHAPYGGHAQTVAFIIQGRDVCEMWSGNGRNRSLEEEEFRALCWEVAAECITDAITDHGKDHKYRSEEEALTLYLQNKSMRVISSDLNGFSIMIEHYLADLCYLQFLYDEDDSAAAERLGARVLASWQTDMVRSLWSCSPLETWVEGVSKDGKWLIKVQSSQDGNEGHKTKELAGRSRAMHLSWKALTTPADRSKWSFGLRAMPKTALVLDGDWNRTRKKNLYEAGWDWVGDVRELDELRSVIKGK